MSDNIRLLGKLLSTDDLPLINEIGDAWEVDTFMYVWDSDGWVVSSTPKSRMNQVPLSSMRSVEGPQGKPGDVWIPSVDGFGYLSWEKNFGTTPPVVQNITGPQGTIGPRGYQGVEGPVGQRGIEGPQGIAGPIGPKGDKGFTGDRGLQGEQGLTGLTGKQGIQGPKGDQGLRGATGQQGVQGYGLEHRWVNTVLQVKTENENWDTGVNLRGERGLTGLTGLQGIKGDQGALGLDGTKGDIGPIGPTGAQGLKGNDGTGVSILGSFSYTHELPKTGKIGDAYLISGNLYTWSQNAGTYVNVGQIKGPQGEQGLSTNVHIDKVISIGNSETPKIEVLESGNDKYLS
ncbi:MAG: hypothetical protein ACRC5T_11415, partial [Cetobacterium sp.]